MAPNPAAFKAGKSLSSKSQWQQVAQNERVVWGLIKGSGKNPYLVQIDKNALAYKCTCPSRQFPCKHGIALMLLYATAAAQFEQPGGEPEWVKAWMDKRLGKAEKPETTKELSPEDIEKREKSKEKTQKDRFASVQGGAAELELWLKDLIRMGIIELPNKPAAEFAKVASRMIDAKAPGLAGRVKALGEIGFADQQNWQGQAMEIISKLFLLLKAFSNYEHLNPEWQITLKNLLGWSQSSKELLASTDAEKVKDSWLVMGQETELEEELVIQRNFLLGLNTGRKALILNFATRFTTIENPPVPGTILKAELAFFPSVLPHRAVVKMQNGFESNLNLLPVMLSGWEQVYQHKAELLKINPFVTDMVVLIDGVSLVRQEKEWLMADKDGFYMKISDLFDLKKLMKWLAFSGNEKTGAAAILRNGKVYPLGLFYHQSYILL
jgi:hypothetical protein